MKISDHLDKNNMHHAYLIEGNSLEVVPEVFEAMIDLGIKTQGNPDFSHIHLDSFKIEDARNLKSFAFEKGNSANKRIFLISTNSFLLEAQNAMLKMFEEPIHNTHFFVIVPDVSSLLKTFTSRFYLIKSKINENNESKEAEKFIAMPLKNRIDFIKELLTEPEGDEDLVVELSSGLDSARPKALKFLNALEVSLHQKMSKTLFDTHVFDQIFKVREFLRQPGSSVKSLMESVALVIPNF